MGKKVLIIDDEPIIVQSTGFALEFFGFEVCSAASGPDGLEAARQNRPDAILLDIMMPGMDGWEVLSKLKALEATAGIPVILFTAKEYSNGSKKALACGAADFLPKPFEPDRLRIMLETHIH